MIYEIWVCPECETGPLVFDPDGLDRDEGMAPRAVCENGHIVLAPGYEGYGMPSAHKIRVTNQVSALF